MQVQCLTIEQQSTLLLEILTDPAKHDAMLRQLLARDNSLTQRSKELDTREKAIQSREKKLESRLAKLLKD